MLYIDSFDELVDILKECAFEEECGHAFYIADAEKITLLLNSLTKLTNAKLEFIDFNNFLGEGCEYYNLSLDYDEGDLRYSVSPAVDEDGDLYPDYGLCLVDECVYEDFEEDYKAISIYNEDFESPIRVCWGEEPEEDEEEDKDCKKCTYNCDAPCCNKNNVEEKTKIDTDNKGKVCGFTKSWSDKNSFFIYSFRSSNEDDVLDLMKHFKIGRS